MLGLRFYARAFSSCGKRGPLFIAVRGLLTIAASLVAEHRLQTRRLSSCGSRAQLLRGMWDLPRPGLKPVSPALAGRFSTTVPPGEPFSLQLLKPSSNFICCLWEVERQYNYLSFVSACMPFKISSMPFALCSFEVSRGKLIFLHPAWCLLGFITM